MNNPNYKITNDINIPKEYSGNLNDDILYFTYNKTDLTLDKRTLFNYYFKTIIWTRQKFEAIIFVENTIIYYDLDLNLTVLIKGKDFKFTGDSSLCSSTFL